MKMTGVLEKCLLAGVVAVMLCGCMAPRQRTDYSSVPPRSSTNSGSLREMRIGDRLYITFSTTYSLEAYMNPCEAVIDGEGNIPLPLIGAFRVGGMMPSVAGNAIAKKYVEEQIYTSDLVVNVINKSEQEFVDEYYVTGEVRQRGKFPLKSGITLRQALIAAGDLSEYASDRGTLTRDGVIQDFNLEKIRSGRANDLVIFAGDIIEVKRRIL